MALGTVATGLGLDAQIGQALKRFWGYDSLRPLQLEAIHAGLEHRDSLVVLPTGGGKSLCYQVPPVIAGRTDVVVSPLISLMKDQVDALRACGYAAAALHSGLRDEERRQIAAGIAANRYHLVFAAPERLLTDWFLGVVERLDVRAFHIDEAHCISQWGHDFRPEYRRLRALKERFPRASVHGYTATATPGVRGDIIEQLGLKRPNVLVGRFDRPNLVYRIQPRVDGSSQVLDVLRRHRGEAAIVYCITRKETEEMARFLRASGARAAAYHAGMTAPERAKTQEDFAAERLDVVVATVAFGMGIDRSNVRCVVHAAMPKSVEHYQQETGRAGRDGLEAECVLLYSAQDFRRWDFVLAKSAEEAGISEEVQAAQRRLLEDMQRLATSAVCRHAALSRYFGQEYESADCRACDVCLGEVESIAESNDLARKVLACVSEVGQRFGIGHVVDVLVGSRGQRVQALRHDGLPSFAALAGTDRRTLQSLVYQLVDQGLLERTPGDRPVVRLGRGASTLLRGEASVRLVRPAANRQAAVDAAAWQEADQGLFEHLRGLRRTIAEERRVPAFIVLGDAPLREIAGLRPASVDALRRVRGIGEQKLADLGERIVRAVVSYCAANRLSTTEVTARGADQSRTSAGKQMAFRLFEKGRPLQEVAGAIGRAPSTTAGYLAEFVSERRPKDVDAWVSRSSYQRVARAAAEGGEAGLKAIFERLDGSVSYDEIRVVLSHMASRPAAAPERPPRA